MAFDDESYMQRRLAEQRRRRTEPVFNPTADDLSQRGVLRRSQTPMFNPTADELAARGAVRRPELAFNPTADELTRRGVTGPQSKDFGTVIGAPQDEGNYSTPSNFGYEQRIFGDTAGADKERLQRISDVDSALSDLRLSAGGLNMRSKRDLFGQLLGEKNRLTSQAYGAQTERAIAGARQASDEAQAAARLSANAQEGNAERRQRQSQFNLDFGQRERELGLRKRQDDVMAQLLREKQSYENDALRQQYSDARLKSYLDQGLTPQQAQEQVAADFISVGQPTRGNINATAGFDRARVKGAKILNRGHGWMDGVRVSDEAFNPDAVDTSQRTGFLRRIGTALNDVYSGYGNMPGALASSAAGVSPWDYAQHGFQRSARTLTAPIVNPQTGAADSIETLASDEDADYINRFKRRSGY